MSRLVEVGWVAGNLHLDDDGGAAAVLPVPPMGTFKGSNERSLGLTLGAFNGVAGLGALHVGTLAVHVQGNIRRGLPAENHPSALSHMGIHLLALTRGKLDRQ